MARGRSKSLARECEGQGVVAAPPMRPLNDRNRRVAEKRGERPPTFAANLSVPAGATARQRAANHIINHELAAAAINNARNRQSVSKTASTSVPPAPRGRGRPPKQVPDNVPRLIPQETRPQPSNSSYRAIRTPERPPSRTNNNRSRVKPEQESEISYTDDTPSYSSSSTRKRLPTHERSEEPGPSRPAKISRPSPAPRKSRSRGPVTPAPNGVFYSSTRGPVARPDRFGANSEVTSPTTPRKLPKAMAAAASVADRYAGRKPAARQGSRAASADARKSRSKSRATRSPSAPTNTRRSASVASSVASGVYRRQRDKAIDKEVPNPNIPFHPNPSVIIYLKVKGNRNQDAPFPNTFMRDPRLEDNEDDTQLVMDCLYDYMETKRRQAAER